MQADASIYMNNLVSFFYQRPKYEVGTSKKKNDEEEEENDDNVNAQVKSKGWMLNDTENLNVKYATMNN